MPTVLARPDVPDFLEGIEAFLQSFSPEEVAVTRKVFQHLTAHQLLLLGRASQGLGSQGTASGPDADAAGNRRRRAATLGRDAMNRFWKER